jgi:death-on-curing protein
VTAYLSVQQVQALHRILVREFGGATELRDVGALEAAVARPAMTFGGDDLYADLPAKGAALAHSLVLIHPFVNGHKRAGAASVELVFLLNGWALVAGDEELEGVTLASAKGEVEVEALTIWFRQRLRPVT